MTEKLSDKFKVIDIRYAATGHTTSSVEQKLKVNYSAPITYESSEKEKSNP
jgi:hypothetical protein